MPKKIPTSLTTSELAVAAAGSRYDLVLMASRRARELNSGWQPLINDGNGAVVTALKEIEAGHVGRDYLLKPQNIDRKHDRPPQVADK